MKSYLMRDFSEDMHDRLRIAKVMTKTDIKDLILSFIEDGLNKVEAQYERRNIAGIRKD